MVRLQDDSRGKEQAYCDIMEHSIDLMVGRVRVNPKEDRDL